MSDSSPLHYIHDKTYQSLVHDCFRLKKNYETTSLEGSEQEEMAKADYERYIAQILENVSKYDDQHGRLYFHDCNLENYKKNYPVRLRQYSDNLPNPSEKKFVQLEIDSLENPEKHRYLFVKYDRFYYHRLIPPSLFEDRTSEKLSFLKNKAMEVGLKLPFDSGIESNSLFRDKKSHILFNKIVLETGILNARNELNRGGKRALKYLFHEKGITKKLLVPYIKTLPEFFRGMEAYYLNIDFKGKYSSDDPGAKWIEKIDFIVEQIEQEFT